MPLRNTRNGIHLEIIQGPRQNMRSKGKKIILEGGSVDGSGGEDDDDEYDDEDESEEDESEKDEEKKEKEKAEKVAKGSNA